MSRKIKSILEQIIYLNNWFIAHNMSSYKNADQSTKDHVDKLAIEFNSRWKEIIKNKSKWPIYTQKELDEAILQEREVCVLVCDKINMENSNLVDDSLNKYLEGKSDGANNCAKAIRER